MSNLRLFQEVCSQHFDLSDRATLKKLSEMMEAEQTPIVEAEQDSVILSLTTKLYSMIVDKVDDIDFGEIPDSRGDITKLTKFEDIQECIKVMSELLKRYHQDDEPIKEIGAAIDHMIANRDLFTKGYMTNTEIIMVTYCEAVLAIIESLSFMIAATIEYVKTPNNDGFQLAVDKAGVARTKKSMIYNSLKNFNKAMAKGQVRDAFEPFLKAKVKNLAGVDDLVLVMGIMSLVAILTNILPILREFTFFFFSVRTRISQYFDIQADLLEMNARTIEMNKAETVEDRAQVVKRQKAIADMFRKVSNKICIDQTQKDKLAPKEIEQANKKVKYEDVTKTDKTIPSHGPTTTDSIF